METKILGIKNSNELEAFPDKLSIRIQLKYPEYQDLLKLVPKERIKVINQRRRATFKQFIGTLDVKEFKRIGSKIAPSGLELDCSKKELLSLNEEASIEHISILTKSNTDTSESSTEEHYFAIMARFAIQVENKMKGLQNFEDRILLIKASSQENAAQKLRESFKNYEEPYLNPKGELVRWKFETFLESYETHYTSLEDMQKDESVGIELFSTLKTRRLNAQGIWKREY